MSPAAPVLIRRATAADQAAIRQMVHEARLDPTDLHWSHFVVAEEGNEVVGIGQIRPYPKCRELGSLVVREDRRGQGIGGLVIRALLEGEPGDVYLECSSRMASYYVRFGFQEIRWQDAPMPLRLKAGMGNLLGRLLGRRLAVMVRVGG